MGREMIVVIAIDENGGNTHHVITADQHAAWREGDGTDGQDRQNYSDDQDRDSYAVEDDLVAFASANGTSFDTWTGAAAHVAAEGGAIADVIAAEEPEGE